MPRSKKLSKKRCSGQPFIIERKETKRNKSIIKDLPSVLVSTHFTGEIIGQTEEVMPEEIEEFEIEESVI